MGDEFRRRSGSAGGQPLARDRVREDLQGVDAAGHSRLSDQRGFREPAAKSIPTFHVPHCDEMQVLEWDNMLAALDPTKPEKAHFTCIVAAPRFEEHHRPQMLARFEWRAQNPGARREHRSFWIWSAYSYLQSFARIASEWLKARGDPASEKTFINDAVGKAYRAQGEARPWEELRDRANESHYVRGNVPAGALLLMLGMDCQHDRVEWQLVGFGRDYRRYVVDYRHRRPAHLAIPTAGATSICCWRANGRTRGPATRHRSRRDRRQRLRPKMSGASRAGIPHRS